MVKLPWCLSIRKIQEFEKILGKMTIYAILFFSQYRINVWDFDFEVFLMN